MAPYIILSVSSDTFILLDQINGRTWQVQWSLEPEKRIVIPIE